MELGPFIILRVYIRCLCIPNKMAPGLCVTCACLVNVKQYIQMIAELICLVL
uniref:Uncharacterized protein n=1 Tax=Zea mays TaxID=4577 RepID=B6SRM9_MAIZE|nr:hypothetical protein [Zea mays]